MLARRPDMCKESLSSVPTSCLEFRGYNKGSKPQLEPPNLVELKRILEIKLAQVVERTCQHPSRS